MIILAVIVYLLMFFAYLFSAMEKKMDEDKALAVAVFWPMWLGFQFLIGLYKIIRDGGRLQ